MNNLPAHCKRLAGQVTIAITFALALALALALGASSAHALVHDFADVTDPDFGPAISGEGVIYATTQLDSDNNVADFINVSRIAPGQKPTLLSVFDVGNQSHRLDLAASESVFAAGLTAIDDCSGGNGEPYLPCVVKSEFAGGPLAESAPQKLGCLAGLPQPNNYGEPFYVQPLVAVSGTRIASIVGDKARCDGSSRIRLIDSLGVLPPVTLPDSAQYVGGLALEGRYLAWSEPAAGVGRVQFALYDTATSAVVHRTTLRTARYSNVYFDVQADGTIAVNGRLLSNKKRRGKLVRFCRKNTTQAVVTINPNGTTRCAGISASPDGVKLANGIVMAYEQYGKHRQRLVTVDLSSGARRVHRTTTRADTEAFDFDGTRVAWFEKKCVGWRMRMADYETGLATPQARCPISVGTRVMKLSRFDRATVPITCPAGCSGHWSIKAPRRIADDSPVHDGEVVFYDGDFMTYPASPQPRQHRFHFYHHVRDWIKRNKPRRITLEFTSYAASIDGINSSKSATFRIRYR